MSLTLRILGRGQLDNGAPVEFVLHQRGAIIGRAATCDWPLPDPTRFISGRHCRVLFQDNGYFFEDTSTNGTFLNGETRPLAGVHRISSGDRFQIGEYLVEAQLSGAAREAFLQEQASIEAANAPPRWADWDDVPGAINSPPPTPPPAFAAENPWGLEGAKTDAVSQWADRADANTGRPGADDIFSKLTDQHQVDWSNAAWDVGSNYSDPFAFDAPAPMVDRTSPPPVPLSFPEPPPAAARDPFDPLPAGTGGVPLPPPITPAASSGDPFGSLGPAPAVPPGAQAGDPFGALNAVPSPLARNAVPPISPAPPDRAAAPMPAAPPATEPRTTGIPAPLPPTAGMIDASYQELIRALGIDPTKFKEPTGQTSARAGRALRRLLAGLMVLLEARARAKDQMGASATQLRFDGNNPLKFAPGVDQALEMMLNPPIRGYMEADLAIEDAFRDLQAHQIATLKAMQGALQATLQRFSPSAIKARTEDKGLLGKVLRSQRDAALWQAYEKEFNGVAQDSAEAFLEVFAKEFRKAYEDAARSP